MPSAIIHAGVAKEINKILKLDDKLFILGNIAPDCWRNSKNVCNRNLSHFLTSPESGENYKQFYYKYKNNLSDPFVLGYLIHLMTDSYWRVLERKEFRDLLIKSRLPINESIVSNIPVEKRNRDNFYFHEHAVLGEVAKFYDLSFCHVDNNFDSVIEEIDLTVLNDTIDYINSAYFNLEAVDNNIYDFNEILKDIKVITGFVLNELEELSDKNI